MEGLNELLSSMSDILLKASEELGVGVNFLKDNFIEFLPEIGRYLFITKFVDTFVIMSLLGMLVLLVVSAIAGDNGYHAYEMDKFKSVWKSYWKYPLIVSFVLALLKHIGFLVAPRIWTLHHLMDMVR